MDRIIDKNMNNERTPLITSIGLVKPRPRYRYGIVSFLDPNSTSTNPLQVRQFCTIATGPTLIVLILFFLLQVTLIPDHHRPHYPSHKYPSPPRRHKSSIPFPELQDILTSTPSEEKAQEWSKYYTSGPHLAGKNYSQVTWTQQRWEEFGVKAEIVAYDTYINYPLGHRLALYEKRNDRDNVLGS